MSTTKESYAATTTTSKKSKGEESEANSLENFSAGSSSFRLHTSQNSVSSESDLSFSFSIDRELDTLSNRIIDDELPAFEIRLISPLGRTPSPIDVSCVEETQQTPTKNYHLDEDLTPSSYHNTDYVALHDINAQISPPGESEKSITRSSSLETIFEGVFLSTPPRPHCSLRNRTHSRSNIFEKLMLGRLNVNKESLSPLSRPTSAHPLTNIIQAQNGTSDECTQ